MVRKFQSITRAFGIAALLASAMLVPSTAHADTDPTNLYVATTGTVGGGSCVSPDFVGTDQSPIQAAVDAAINDAGAEHTIHLCEGTWNFTAEVLIPVKAETLTVQGAGANRTVLDGQDVTRLLHVQGNIDSAAASVILNVWDVKITRGSTVGSDFGGGIWVEGQAGLHVERSVFTANHAAVHGGAIASFGTDGPHNWVGGEFTIDNSYFENNSASVDGGAVLNAANAFPGLVVRNSSFVGNSVKLRGGGAMANAFAAAKVYGSTFLNNSAPGQSGLGLGDHAGWGNEAIGNIIANRTTDGQLCGGAANWLIEANIVTDPACSAHGNATVVSYDSLQFQAADPRLAVPYVTIGADSAARNVWSAATCLASDVVGHARPTTGSDCDAGAWERPADWRSGDTMRTHLAYTNTSPSTAAVTTAPVTTGGASYAAYASVSPAICSVDPLNGSVIGYVNGSCLVEVTVFSDGSADPASDSATVTISGTASIPAVPGAYAAVVDTVTGTTYSVAGGVAAIARTSADGVLTADWVTLGAGAQPNNIAITSDGTLYVTDQGRIRVLRISNTRTETPTLTDDWADLTAGFTPYSLAVDEVHRVVYAGIVGETETKHTVGRVAYDETGTATAIQPDWAVLPGVGPTDIAYDVRGYVWTAGWWAGDGSISRVNTASGETTTVMAPNGSGAWPYTVSIDPTGTVYTTNYNGTLTRIPGGDIANIDWAWTDLGGTDGLLTGIVADTTGVYVAHQGTDSIVRVQVAADGTPTVVPRWRTFGGGTRSQLMNRVGTTGLVVANSGTSSLAQFAFPTAVPGFAVETGTLTTEASPSTETHRQADLGTAANGLGIGIELIVPVNAVETTTKFSINSNSSVSDLFAGRLNVVVTAMSDTRSITTFAEPIELRLTGIGGLLPAFSTDGSAWSSLPQLSDTFTLTAGEAGYQTRSVSGGLQYRIFTTHLTSFTLQSVQPTLTVVPSATTVTAGGTLTTALAGGAGTGAVTYSSSNAAACTVSASGTVTAVAQGSCDITATKAADANYRSATSAAVTITVNPVQNNNNGNGGGNNGNGGGAPASASTPPLTAQTSAVLAEIASSNGFRQLRCTAPTWSRDAQSVEFSWQGVTAANTTVTAAPWTATVDIPTNFAGRVGCEVLGFSAGATARVTTSIEVLAPQPPASTTTTTPAAPAATPSESTRTQPEKVPTKSIPLSFNKNVKVLNSGQISKLQKYAWRAYSTVRISGSKSTLTASRVQSIQTLLRLLGFKGKLTVTRTAAPTTSVLLQARV